MFSKRVEHSRNVTHLQNFQGFFFFLMGKIILNLSVGPIGPVSRRMVKYIVNDKVSYLLYIFQN